MANRSHHKNYYAQFVFWLILLPRQALAVQHHGGIEGLISHQTGHILFTIGMTFMLFKVYKEIHKEPGWFEFRGFLWFTIFWNILTFTGHWLHESISSTAFSIVNNHPVSFTIKNLPDTLFYLSRFDHILLVPAIFLLYRALYKWSQST